jgi:TonB family protein
MTLYRSAQEQREKQAKELRFSLFYCLIGSIALHIVVLILGLKNLLIRFPQVKDEPIEVTLIEVPRKEVKKPPEHQKLQLNVNAGASSVGGKFGQRAAYTSSISVAKQPYMPPSHIAHTPAKYVAKQPQSPRNVQPIASPVQKLANTFKTSPPITEIASKAVPTNDSSILKNSSINKLLERLKTQSQQPTTPTETVSKTVPTKNSSINKLLEHLKTQSQQPTTLNQPSNSVATTLPTALGHSTGAKRTLTSSQSTSSAITKGSENTTNNELGNRVGNNSGNRVGNNSGNGVGNDSGNRVGNNSANNAGNQKKKEDIPVATSPKPPTDNNSLLDSADCVRCDIKYPDRARRRGVEASPEIAVDTDERGNVTHVRLIHSSGDRELDEASQRAAQEWKLKPKSGGRQGVRVSVNFAIKGSQRYRELQERQREREAAQKKRETTTSISTSQAIPLQRVESNTTYHPPRPIESSQQSRRRHLEDILHPPQPIESSQQSRPEGTPRRRRHLEDILRPPQPIESSQQSRPEGTPRRRRHLEDILRPPQPIESSQQSKPEGAPRIRRNLEDILRRRPQTSNSQEGSSERVKIRRKRLEEILQALRKCRMTQENTDICQKSK